MHYFGYDAQLLERVRQCPDWCQALVDASPLFGMDAPAPVLKELNTLQLINDHRLLMEQGGPIRKALLKLGYEPKNPVKDELPAYSVGLANTLTAELYKDRYSKGFLSEEAASVCPFPVYFICDFLTPRPHWSNDSAQKYVREDVYSAFLQALSESRPQFSIRRLPRNDSYQLQKFEPLLYRSGQTNDKVKARFYAHGVATARGGQELQEATWCGYRLFELLVKGYQDAPQRVLDGGRAWYHEESKTLLHAGNISGENLLSALRQGPVEHLYSVGSALVHYNEAGGFCDMQDVVRHISVSSDFVERFEAIYAPKQQRFQEMFNQTILAMQERTLRGGSTASLPKEAYPRYPRAPLRGL